MREILYKAKRFDSDEWAEGCLLTNGKEAVICNYIAYGLGVCGECGSPSDEFYVVDQETVCEYTGRDDIDGNKIFEHDMVQIGYIRSDKSIAWYAVHEVVYRDGAYMIGGEPLCNLGKYIRLKRIGNIYEKRAE